ncbi:hypothetical protein FN846DRAFT_916197 [Sphaerosporella brunnea]|uniref:Uncharacterized protein n=1 Tax=Sphaerosporella brunnea TaxID=1250544 RepID=A0A5J5F966_9PEZI|nr:hypothetical protein FN846DRAFT_916197 [Sphaerosporella brunnea]
MCGVVWQRWIFSITVPTHNSAGLSLVLSIQYRLKSRTRAHPSRSSFSPRQLLSRKRDRDLPGKVPNYQRSRTFAISSSQSVPCIHAYTFCCCILAAAYLPPPPIFLSYPPTTTTTSSSSPSRLLLLSTLAVNRLNRLPTAVATLPLSCRKPTGSFLVCPSLRLHECKNCAQSNFYI